MKGSVNDPKIGKSVADSEDEDRITPLSGKPFFDVILSRTNIKPTSTLLLPAKIYSELPPGEVPVVLMTNSGKKWDVLCSRGNQTRMLKNGWQNFVDDNNLKIGDGLVFELLVCSSAKIELKVQILRGDFPSELMSDSDSECGDGTADNPIVL